MDNTERLILGLQKQIELMLENAALMASLYPDLGHHTELIGAAQITQNWLDNIKQ